MGTRSACDTPKENKPRNEDAAFKKTSWLLETRVLWLMVNK
jgi:hypothetical protein